MALRSFASGVEIVPYPSGVVPGDYLVMIVHGGQPVLSDWTKTNLNVSGDGIGSAVYIRDFSGSGSSVDLGSADYAGNIFAFTNVTFIAATSAGSAGFDSDITAPSVFASATNYLLSGYSIEPDAVITVPASQQDSGQVFVSGTQTFTATVGYELIAATGITGTRVATTDGFGTTVGVSVVVFSPPNPPANTVAPAVTPTSGVVGATFSCTTGTWTNSPTSYAYQWKLNGSNIGGATSSTYVAISAGSLTCAVTASNAGGPGTPATSNAATVTLPAGDRARLLLLGAT